MDKIQEIDQHIEDNIQDIDIAVRDNDAAKLIMIIEPLLRYLVGRKNIRPLWRLVLQALLSVLSYHKNYDHDKL